MKKKRKYEICEKKTVFYVMTIHFSILKIPVIGGWGGNQTVIRRQQQSQSPLAVIQHSGIISSQNWTEFLIQITTSKFCEY